MRPGRLARRRGHCAGDGRMRAVARGRQAGVAPGMAAAWEEAGGNRRRRRPLSDGDGCGGGRRGGVGMGRMGMEARLDHVSEEGEARGDVGARRGARGVGVEGDGEQAGR